MPKRSLDIPDTMGPGDQVPPLKAQKTERSHEENQERAYIAASRRADRSLEARVQSARMASEIHRRRTGRGLKVTEEIVLKEEMYEEEEDDIPRHYKYLAAHLQTNSSDMNSRVSAYITTQAAMATMARYNEVNRLFSESFPSTMQYQHQMNSSSYMAPFMNKTHGQPQSPSHVSSPQSRHHSLSGPPQQVDNMSRRVSSVTASSTPTMSGISSPPPLSPESTSQTTDSRSTPCQTPIQAFPPLDPQLQPSSFTSELPNEVKMMANVDMSDPMAPYFFGGNPATLQTFGQQPEEELKLEIPTDAPDAVFTKAPELKSPFASGHEQFDETLFSPVDGFEAQLDYSQLAEHGVGINEGTWESFVDFGSEH